MKITTDQIQGFENMTPEEKLSALLELDLPDPVDLSDYVKKEDLDAKAAEAESLTRELRQHKSAEENAKADADKAMQDLQNRYNQLLRDSTIANHTAKYMTLPGFDEKLAQETAQALFDGDMEKVFANQQQASANYEKSLKAQSVKREGQMPGSGGKEPEEDEAVKLARQLGQKRMKAAQPKGLDRFLI